MGSKHRLLPWLEGVLGELEFDTALDAFSGSGCVAYLLKTMGKEVRANDFLQFACDLTRATVANSHATLGDDDLAAVREPAPGGARFIEETFRGIFFADEDNRFLDRVVHHAAALDPARRALVLAVAAPRLPQAPAARRVHRVRAGPLRRRAPRPAPVARGALPGVGRPLQRASSSTTAASTASRAATSSPLTGPTSTSTSCTSTRPTCRAPTTTATSSATTSSRGSRRTGRTPSSTPRAACASSPSATRRSPTGARRNQAFRRLFERFAGSTIVLSYSSNGYPDLDALTRLLRRAQGRRDGARAGAPLPLRHPPRRGAGAGGGARVPAGRRLSCAARQEPVRSLRLRLRRGHQPGTAARYASYSAPKVLARVGSS